MQITRRCLLAVAGAPALALAGSASAGPVPALRPFREDVKAPATSLPRLDGRAVSLEDFAGRPIVLSFWATWCIPCRRELPSLLRLQADLGDEAAILAVAVGEDRERVAPYLDRGGLGGLNVLLDRGRVAAADWRVQSLPLTYLIDTRRRIAFSAPGEVDWDDAAVRAQVAGLLRETRRAT